MHADRKKGASIGPQSPQAECRVPVRRRRRPGVSSPNCPCPRSGGPAGPPTLLWGVRWRGRLLGPGCAVAVLRPALARLLRLRRFLVAVLRIVRARSTGSTVLRTAAHRMPCVGASLISSHNPSAACPPGCTGAVGHSYAMLRQQAKNNGGRGELAGHLSRPRPPGRNTTMSEKKSREPYSSTPTERGPPPKPPVGIR